MKKIVTVVEQRPNYYRGQLLLEDDFLAEQNYHANARRRHNLNLHGWGIVRGFTVSRESANSIIINPGFAIDQSGDEIFLNETKHINLEEFGPNELLRVGLTYKEATGSEGGAGAPQNRRDCYAVITVSRISEDSARLILATIQLDGQGKINKEAIDYSQTKYVKILAPGSITPTELDENLRKSWLRLPFRPDPLVEAEPDEPEEERDERPPAFRVGATESLSPDPKEADEKDRGAAGTMAIPVPPGITQVTRLRIAGSANDGEILFKLFAGGWDPGKNKHVRKKLVDKKITSAPFLETFDIDDTSLDPEYQTLSIWLRGTRRTAISLIAIEFVY